MSLVPAVTELLLAELMYLQYDNPTKPIFLYINSAGVQVCFPNSCSVCWGQSRERESYEKFPLEIEVDVSS